MSSSSRGSRADEAGRCSRPPPEGDTGLAAQETVRKICEAYVRSSWPGGAAQATAVRAVVGGAAADSHQFTSASRPLPAVVRCIQQRWHGANQERVIRPTRKS